MTSPYTKEHGYQLAMNLGTIKLSFEKDRFPTSLFSLFLYHLSPILDNLFNIELRVIDHLIMIEYSPLRMFQSHPPVLHPEVGCAAAASSVK